MRKFKGTPGPWKIKMSHSEVESATGSKNGMFHSLSGHLCNSDGSAIAHVMGVKFTTGKNGWVPYEEAEYNGALISAAPDLLQALQNALDYNPDNAPDCDRGAWVLEARISISKALNVEP